MNVINKRGKQLKKEREQSKVSERDITIASDMVKHLDRIALLNVYDKDIERAFLLDELKVVNGQDRYVPFNAEYVRFSPSSASKCERELFLKAMKAEQDTVPMLPYQKRWVRNGSAVHAETQKGLLYGEKHLENPAFTVERMEDGSPAWERNIKDIKTFTHNGVTFQLFGMMDGIIHYHGNGNGNPTRMGFEFKTKSTTVAAIGDYKLKAPQEGHVEQAVCYSLLFGVDEFVFVYETLAKDGWMKNLEAKPDTKAFHITINEDQKVAMLDKFARVADQYYKKFIPAPDFNKCIFCPFKSTCNKIQEQGVL
jgi:hypothetical protein